MTFYIASHYSNHGITAEYRLRFHAKFTSHEDIVSLFRTEEVLNVLQKITFQGFWISLLTVIRKNEPTFPISPDFELDGDEEYIDEEEIVTKDGLNMILNAIIAHDIDCYALFKESVEDDCDNISGNYEESFLKKMKDFTLKDDTIFKMVEFV